MIKRISFPFDFKNVFISILLDTSDIKAEGNLDINRSKNFNINIQIYLTFEKEYEEFIIIRINFNIVKNNGEKYLYNKDDLYLKSNNVGYNDIIQMNYIYNYYVLYLRSKAIYNFFFKVIFKFIKKVYKEEETRYWIFIIRITMYRIFISLLEYPPIYIKEGIILERC